MLADHYKSKPDENYWRAVVATLTATYLLRHAVAFRNQLDRLRDILGFLLIAALISPSISATVGVGSFCLSGAVSCSNFWDLWPVWWLGDAFGMVIVTPVLLTWLTYPLFPWRGWRAVEAIVTPALIVGVALLAFGREAGPGSTLLTSALFPLVIWAALRSGPREATTVSLAICTIAIGGTTLGHGPFIQATTNDSLSSLWIFCGTVTIASLILAAAMKARHASNATYQDLLRHIRELDHSEGKLDRHMLTRAEAAHTQRQVSLFAIFAVATPLLFFVFEQIRQVLTTTLSLRLTRLLSIFLGTIVVLTVSYYVSRRQGNIYRRLLGEVTKRKRIEEEQQALAAHNDRLAALTQALAAEIADRERVEMALRQSEEHYRMLFVHVPLGIFQIDPDGVVVDCNDKFVEIMGSSRATVIGFNTLAGVENEAVQEAIARALQGKIGRYEGDYRSVTGRKQRTVHATFGPVLAEDGTLLGGIGIVEDVTERVQIKEAMRQAQKLESLGVLAGGVAHDFNNLLAAMLGQTSLALARLSPDHPASHAIAKAVRAAERASDLTRQLLAYAGRGRYEPQNVQLNALLEDNMRLLRVTIPGHVTLQANLNGGLPPVKADPGQMQQIVMNLLINAAEAIGEEEGVITISTGTETVAEPDEIVSRFTGDVLEPGRYVTLTVRDDGCGMDEETLRKIFDPFFTTKFSGRGLGLAAVLGIVRAHEGALKVESTPGAGTTFKLYLPAHAANVAPTRLEQGGGGA